MTRTVERCPCGSPACRDWHVHPEIAVQGAALRSEPEARLVARVLDRVDASDGSVEAAVLQLAEEIYVRLSRDPAIVVVGPIVSRVQLALLDALVR